MDYDKTPSFYKNNEMFEKYLGNSSYYIGLQNALSKLIALTKAQNILELGCGNGSTCVRIAKENDDCDIVAVDMREDIVNVAKGNAKDVNNLSFETSDMTDYVKDNGLDFDFIYLLYSFHHILDPLENKVYFLEKCYNNMNEGAYLAILETFLPNEVNDGFVSVDELFVYRAKEGYASTFWNVLDNIGEIDLAKEIGEFSKSNELNAGVLVANRDNEYLVNDAWLVSIAEEVGFSIVLCEPCNAVMDKVILLRK